MGGKLVEKLSGVVGSWTYIGIQTAIFVFWVSLNVAAPSKSKIDPYPFSFLNLFVGFMSAYTGPVLLMAANRQSEIDRQKILESLSLDQKTEALTQHIDKHMHEVRAILDRLDKGNG